MKFNPQYASPRPLSRCGAYVTEDNRWRLVTEDRIDSLEAHVRRQDARDPKKPGFR